MACLTLLRVLFLVVHWAAFNDASPADLLRAFLVGGAIDSSVVAVVLIPSALLAAGAVLLPAGAVSAGTAARALERAWRRVTAAALVLAVLLNVLDISFFNYFETRTSMKLVDNLNQLGPALATAMRDGLVVWPLAVILAVAAMLRWLEKRLASGLARVARPAVPAALLTVAFLAAASLLYLDEPLWRLTSFAQRGQALSQLSLNGAYTLAAGWKLRRRLEGETVRLNPHRTSDDSVAWLKSRLDPGAGWANGPYPFQRRLEGDAARRPNMVVVLMEGQTASNVAALSPGRRDLSPELSRLAADGILFRNVFAQDTRTHHGLVSTVASFPSVLDVLVTRRTGTRVFLTMGGILKPLGYRSSFVYGYDAHFDHMDFFLRQGGFDRVVERDDFSSVVFESEWGVSDSDLFRKADEHFRELAADNRPFLGVLLTSSNHPPYVVPPGFPEAPEERGEDGRARLYRYADRAMGSFIDQAMDSPYGRNTLFVILADHGEPVDPRDRRLKRFHIPLVMFNPSLTGPPRVVDTVGSQVDVAPTIFSLLGIGAEVNFMGRDLLSGDPEAGFAVMRNQEELFYRAGRSVAVMDLRDDSISFFGVLPGNYLGAPFTPSSERQERVRQAMTSYVDAAASVLSNGLHRVRLTGDSHP